MLAGLNPSDTIKESNVNINSLINANPWRHHNPYVYDPAAAVALIGYSPYGPSYSPHMDLAGRRKNATRETTATLKAWLYEHRKNPYPTKSEKVYLAIMTKMTLTQVSTWFANARRRLKKENKMTWSPRNRTNDDDDDDRQGAGSNSDVSDDECSSPPARITTQNHYSSAPVIVLQHQQTTNNTSSSNTTATSSTTDESPPPRKRKFDEIEPVERKKSSGIWSLADMAEKNPPRSSSISLQERQNTTSQTTSTIGAFKPFK